MRSVKHSSNTAPACSCVPLLWMLAYQSGITVYHRLVYQTSCVHTAAKARVLYERAIEQYLVSQWCGRASTRPHTVVFGPDLPTGKGLVLSRLSLARSEAHRGPKFWPGLLRALHERFVARPSGSHWLGCFDARARLPCGLPDVSLPSFPSSSSSLRLLVARALFLAGTPSPQSLSLYFSTAPFFRHMSCLGQERIRLLTFIQKKNLRS